VLAGRDTYNVTDGDIVYQGARINDVVPEERARAGLFLSFQYPISIPGVNNIYLLQAGVNARRKHLGLEELDAVDFLDLVKTKIALVKLDESFLYRAVNDGFSGGEKKRNEILQMLALEPELSILDETDSGLDIDALKVVADGVNGYRSPERGFVVITHYQRLLDYIKPDFVHVLMDGRLVKSGGPELALELEKRGYAWIQEELNEAALSA
jgi:Fe-S cluster assembly ATP-binding protein